MISPSFEFFESFMCLKSSRVSGPNLQISEVRLSIVVGDIAPIKTKAKISLSIWNI